MIIIRLMGGLGNQLQQYALYRKFIKLGKDARLDLEWFEPKFQEKVPAKRKLEIDLFSGVEYRACTTEERKKVKGSDDLFSRVKRKLLPHTNRIYNETVMYDPDLLGLDEGYLCGYFACEYYFADIMDELRKQLILPYRASNAEIIADIKKSNDNGCSCSIHLRRGDYLDSENTALFGNICTDSYYDSAVSYAIKKGAGCFYVFSQDREYSVAFVDKIKEKYKKDAVYVDLNQGEYSCYDISLMSLCRINICANSTFSFWGARLNDDPDKTMIRPTIQKNTQVFDEEEMKKLWEDWVFIDPDGKIYI